MKIDEGRWRQCQLTGLNHPLYTVPWEPEKYINGLHTLYVRAKDRSGSFSEISHQFALDGSKPLFPILSRLALMMDVTSLVGLLSCVKSLSIYFKLNPLTVSNCFWIGHRILRRSLVHGASDSPSSTA